MRGKWTPFPYRSLGHLLPFWFRVGHSRPAKPPLSSNPGSKVQGACQASPLLHHPEATYLIGRLQNPAPTIKSPPLIVVARALSIESMNLGKLVGGRMDRRSKKTSGLPPEARSCILFIYIMSRCWATRPWPKWQGGGVSCCNEPGWVIPELLVPLGLVHTFKSGLESRPTWLWNSQMERSQFPASHLLAESQSKHTYQAPALALAELLGRPFKTSNFLRGECEMTFQNLAACAQCPGWFTQLPSSPLNNQEIRVPGNVHFLSYAKIIQRSRASSSISKVRLCVYVYRVSLYVCLPLPRQISWALRLSFSRAVSQSRNRNL